MERGALSLDDLPGGLDLGLTLESGQTYCWRREDGRMYDGWGTPAPASATGSGTGTGPAVDESRADSPWYYTVVGVDADGTVARRDPTEYAVVRARQADGELVWASTHDADPLLRELLRLDDDLRAVETTAPDDDLIREAFAYARGMRVVRDPPFPTTVSFICSAQMRVSRIYDMVTTLARTYGTAVEFDGAVYHAPPTPAQLAATTEADLRDLGLGYRAPYVQRTGAMVAAGEGHPEDARDRAYEDAREYLTRFVGVGDKVADCVALFALDHLEAVPLDTWIRSAIADYFPECDAGGYAATSRAIRERFGGRYAGYVQTYVFHYLRTRERERERKRE